MNRDKGKPIRYINLQEWIKKKTRIQRGKDTG